MCLNKRGQAVSEFLYTYGWVMFGILAILGVMTYMGFSNYSFFKEEKCVFNSGLSCEDFKYESNVLVFIIKNNMGFAINNINLTAENQECNSSINGTVVLLTNQQKYFAIPCNFSSRHQELDLIATYTISENMQNHTKLGWLKINVD